MLRPEAGRLMRKLFALVVLVLCLSAFAAAPGVAGTPGAYLPCCSACEVENPPLICRHGCTPGCVVDW